MDEAKPNVKILKVKEKSHTIVRLLAIEKNKSMIDILDELCEEINDKYNLLKKYEEMLKAEKTLEDIKKKNETV